MRVIVYIFAVLVASAPEHQPVPPQCSFLGSVLISKFSSQKHPNEEEMTSEALLCSAVLASLSGHSAPVNVTEDP